jgi:hypothetical protein
VREVTLARGLTVALAHELELEVLLVQHPEHLLALQGPGLGREVLSGSALVGRIVPGAPVHLWTDGEAWVCQLPGEPPRALVAGDELVVAGTTLQVLEVPGPAASSTGTVSGGRLDLPLRIDGYFDAVQIHRPGQPVVAFGGAAGRVLCELGAIGQPVYWLEAAKAVWSDGADAEALRKRWDVLMIRLRRRLERAGIRADLLRADGTGNVQLVLQPEDVFLDRS